MEAFELEGVVDNQKKCIVESCGVACLPVSSQRTVGVAEGKQGWGLLDWQTDPSFGRIPWADSANYGRIRYNLDVSRGSNESVSELQRSVEQRETLHSTTQAYTPSRMKEAVEEAQKGVV